MSVPPTITIRAVTSEDAAGYHALRLRALREDPEAFGAALVDEVGRTAEQVAERLAAKTDEDFILGAWVDGALGGIVSLARRDGEKRRHRANIAGMYVAPERRGLGLGRALVDEAVRRARLMDGLETVLLGVSSGNEAARRLYVSCGFEPHYLDERALKINGRYFDLEWMRLTIMR